MIKIFSVIVLLLFLVGCVPESYQEAQQEEISDEVDTSDIDTNQVEGAIVDLLEEGSSKTYK